MIQISIFSLLLQSVADRNSYTRRSLLSETPRFKIRVIAASADEGRCPGRAP